MVVVIIWWGLFNPQDLTRSPLWWSSFQRPWPLPRPCSTHALCVTGCWLPSARPLLPTSSDSTSSHAGKRPSYSQHHVIRFEHSWPREESKLSASCASVHIDKRPTEKQCGDSEWVRCGESEERRKTLTRTLHYSSSHLQVHLSDSTPYNISAEWLTYSLTEGRNDWLTDWYW